MISPYCTIFWFLISFGCYLDGKGEHAESSLDLYIEFGGMPESPFITNKVEESEDSSITVRSPLSLMVYKMMPVRLTMF